MPYLRIKTNTTPDDGVGKELLAAVSSLVSEQLGKHEKFFMGAFEPGAEMIFAGSDAPLASLELKALGLPGQKTKVLSKALCSLVEEKLGIPKDRVYVKFHDVSRGMWGWNGDMF
ncbi:phenylpyruvate tautomerase MIF-related protein [soil metagenome]